jgi:Spy/CpxP family protein refolding chaperone
MVQIMSKRSRLIMATAAGASTLALAGVVGLSSVSAAAVSSNATRASHREQRYEQRLGEAVTNGKLTSAQEQALITEHDKLQAELKAATTASERKTARQSVRKEAIDWAKANNLPGRWLLAPRHIKG